MPDRDVICDVIIVGGGLAGLTAGIDLSRRGFSVTVFESHWYPRHKVCGEYLSGEVLPYLETLGIRLSELDPEHINRVEISTVEGKSISSGLPLGGLGISRFSLDQYLYDAALKEGCQVIFESVANVSFSSDMFTVTAESQKLKSRTVIGSFGKRSSLDKSLRPEVASQKSRWLAAKAHFTGDFPDGVVGLHHFSGGYCGVSKVASKTINICWLASYDSFKKGNGIDDFHATVLSKNPHLAKVFKSSAIMFAPITIGQVSFAAKSLVENHILMAGDSAGMIHPLCGNGMAMAITSARLASSAITGFLRRQTTREQMEKAYRESWTKEFALRMRTGRVLATIFRRRALSKIALSLLTKFPQLLPKIIEQTHGKPDFR